MANMNSCSVIHWHLWFVSESKLDKDLRIPRTCVNGILRRWTFRKWFFGTNNGLKCTVVLLKPLLQNIFFSALLRQGWVKLMLLPFIYDFLVWILVWKLEVTVDWQRCLQTCALGQFCSCSVLSARDVYGCYSPHLCSSVEPKGTFQKIDKM
jgi:hypothetical protein